MRHREAKSTPARPKATQPGSGRGRLDPGGRAMSGLLTLTVPGALPRPPEGCH